MTPIMHEAADRLERHIMVPTSFSRICSECHERTPNHEAPNKHMPDCLITRLRASAPAQTMAWRLIDEDAKDGNDILCGNFDPKYGGYQIILAWDEEENAEFPWVTMDGPRYKAGFVTHYQPLPAAPAAGPKKGE